MTARLDAVQEQQKLLIERVERQQAELIKLRTQLSDTVKKESLNAVRQVEAFLNLQVLMNGNGTTVPYMHGWPVSPDLALQLAQQIRAARYDQIIEFGSGASTVVMARSLQHLGGARLLSFDHLADYCRQTAKLLQDYGLDGLVDLQLAPLVSRACSDGREYSYYDCDAALAATAERLHGVSAPKVLLFVDGPPADTGPMARYPALQTVLAHFPDCEIHVVLDDYIRQDEKDIARAWQDELQRAGRQYIHTVLPLEKGASLLRIEARAAVRLEAEAPRSGEAAA
jgi:predicted O-methyltransferase YrrM